MQSLRRQLISADCKFFTRRVLISAYSDNSRAYSKLGYRSAALQPSFSYANSREADTAAFPNSACFVSEDVRTSGESFIGNVKPGLKGPSSQSANLEHYASAEKGISTGFSNLCGEEGHVSNPCLVLDKPSEASTAAISNSVSFVSEEVQPSGKSLDRLNAVSSESEDLGQYLPAEKGKWTGFCYLCGEKGHMSSLCPKALTTESQILKKFCPCGAGVCTVFTSKTLKNPGRQFYRCPLQEGGCDFFQWCDMDSYQNLSNKDPTINQPVIACPCGAGACLLLTARTQINNGRQFYICPLGRQAGCGFFAWRDMPAPPLSYATAHSSHHGKAGLSSTSKNSDPEVIGPGCCSAQTCYQCGKEGHWARDCPEPQSGRWGKQASGGSDIFGGETRGMLSGSPPSRKEMGAVGERHNCCFKCGMEGHWARGCPNS